MATSIVKTPQKVESESPPMIKFTSNFVYNYYKLWNIKTSYLPATVGRTGLTTLASPQPGPTRRVLLILDNYIFWHDYISCWYNLISFWHSYISPWHILIILSWTNQLCQLVVAEGKTKCATFSGSGRREVASFLSFFIRVMNISNIKQTGGGGTFSLSVCSPCFCIWNNGVLIFVHLLQDDPC